MNYPFDIPAIDIEYEYNIEIPEGKYCCGNKYMKYKKLIKLPMEIKNNNNTYDYVLSSKDLKNVIDIINYNLYEIKGIIGTISSNMVYINNDMYELMIYGIHYIEYNNIQNGFPLGVGIKAMGEITNNIDYHMINREHCLYVPYEKSISLSSYY